MSETPARQSVVPNPLARRPKAHGLRLIMHAGALLISIIMISTMSVRRWNAWPGSPTLEYLAAFAVALVISPSVLHFSGVDEREPRLGAPTVIPRATRQGLAAAGFFALVSRGMSAVAHEFGIGTNRAAPFPVLDLESLNRTAWVALGRRL